ncbi:MAG: hypothetical protein ABIR71_06035 [Chthoniobacterales bacterium]
MPETSAAPPTPPNLFSYATKELSQDAFICWLLGWADPRFAQQGPEVHQCARAVLNAFYATASRSLPSDIREVTVYRQDRNIDVWVELRTGHEFYAVLIEDKTSTGAHSGQLRRYRETMAKGENKAKRNYDDQHLLCIFFKTFDQCDYENIREHGFEVFDRGALLKCIEPFAHCGNAIVHDFYYRMRGIEDEVEAFRTTPIAQWKGQMWVGFYKELRRLMGDRVRWGWVNNVAGGYWGCWWAWRSGLPYFQLRETQAALCASEIGDAAAKKELQERWHGIARDLAKKLDLPLVRPKHMRLGSTMTIAAVSCDYRQADTRGFVDLDATVEFLKRFDELANSWPIDNAPSQAQ